MKLHVAYSYALHYKNTWVYYRIYIFDSPLQVYVGYDFVIVYK